MCSDNDKYRLKNLNYLAPSCNYGKKRIFSKKSGVSYFVHCKLVFGEMFKNFILLYSRKNYLFIDIKCKQNFFILNGEIVIKYYSII